MAAEKQDKKKVQKKRFNFQLEGEALDHYFDIKEYYLGLTPRQDLKPVQVFRNTLAYFWEHHCGPKE
jgi:hypothetical protein